MSKWLFSKAHQMHFESVQIKHFKHYTFFGMCLILFFIRMCLILFFIGMCLILFFIGMCLILFFFRWKMISSVFLTSKESLLAFRHYEAFLRSWFIFCWNFKWFTRMQNIYIICKVVGFGMLMDLFRLFINNRKRRAART